MNQWNLISRLVGLLTGLFNHIKTSKSLQKSKTLLYSAIALVAWGSIFTIGLVVYILVIKPSM